MKNLNNTRGMVSTLLIVLFVLCIVSGLVLMNAPDGRTARLSGWTFIGFSREALRTIHDATGILMALAVVLHLTLNLRWYLYEVRSVLGRRT
ncbi:MAG: DUF4405 domain-containing protein [Anaerolineae bacterium]